MRSTGTAIRSIEHGCLAPLNLVLVIAFALFGCAIAGFAVLFGELTCETGCFGAGSAWKQNPDAPQWGYYWPLGLAFAICVFATVLAARLRRSGYALMALVSSGVFGAALWWRVHLASPNSAGDLWIWQLLGLLLGLAVVATGRRDARK
jgi:hypothetical protein